MSRIIDIADAVVAEISGFTGWSQSLKAVRSYAPRYELKELADLKVTVVPKSMASEVASRSSVQSDYEFDVAIQKHLEGLTDADIDALMGLVQEVVDHWRLRVVTVDGTDAVCIAAANDPVYSPEHLVQMQVFTSVVTLTFRLMEGL